MAVAGTVLTAPAASAAQVQVAADTFSRTVTSGWGSASPGGSYTVDDSAGAFSVSNGKGVIANLEPGNSASAYLAGASADDTQAKSVMTVPSISAGSLNMHHTVEVRRQDDGSSYRGRVKIGANGVLTVGVSRATPGADTGLGSTPIDATVDPGQALSLEVKVTGTSPVSVQVRAWPTGDTVPGWQLTATDSSSARIDGAGSVGVWDYLSSSTDTSTLAYDSFEAYDLDGADAAAGGATPPPPPSGTTYVSANFDGMASGAVDPMAFIASMGATNKNTGAYDDMSIVADSRGSGKVLRTVLRAGTIHSQPGSDNGDNLFIDLAADHDTACVQYDVKFDSNFDWSMGGKLPGLEGVAPGISPNSPSGGHPTSEGWSGRMMWLTPESYGWAGPINQGVSYMYHPGQTTQYGDNVQWGKSFVAGRWHNVKQCYTMNSLGASNGSLKVWFDGQQVVNNTNFVYRTRSDVHITHIMFSIYRGGATMAWAGNRDSYVDIDNFKVTSA